jgi:Spy/CpxP family protein refolding chaperone
MRSATKWIAVVAFAAAAVGLAGAQGQGRGRGGFGGFGGGGPLQLVQNKDVLEDIKATDEEKTKLADWAKEAQPKFGEKLQEKMQDIPMEERFQKMGPIIAELNKELWKDVEKVLKPEQYTRIRQIGVQAMGVRAFTDTDVVAKLKLTDEQKEKVKTVMEDNQKEQMELFQNSGFTPGQPPDQEKMQEFQKKQAELTKKTSDKLKGALTDDQKKAWAELTGKEFDISKLQQGFGRRGRGQ